MNLWFYWKRQRLEIFNPVTIDNPEMIMNVKQSSYVLPEIAECSIHLVHFCKGKQMTNKNEAFQIRN